MSELHGGGLRFTPRVRRRSAEVDCKPGPVPHAGCPARGSDHSSRRRIAAPLEHSTRALAPLCDASGGPPSKVPLFELAPGGACSAAGHPAVARGLLPHDFNLACASLPRASQRSGRSPAIGGVVSVALSLGLPRVAVNDLPAQWSPDFPPAGPWARRRSPIHLRPIQATRFVRSGPTSRNPPILAVALLEQVLLSLGDSFNY